jgi:hypothetical protein
MHHTCAPSVDALDKNHTLFGTLQETKQEVPPYILARIPFTIRRAAHWI